MSFNSNLKKNKQQKDHFTQKLAQFSGIFECEKVT